MRLAVIAASLLIFSTPTFAGGSATPVTPVDPRIQYLNYSPTDIPRVRTYPGISTEIVFGAGETIRDVTSGFNAGWEFSPRGNILYLKPKTVRTNDRETAAIMPTPDKWNTNLLVTTDKRLYAFDLVLLESSAGVTYRLYFRYPREEAAAAREAARERSAQRRLAQQSPAQNWSYTMSIGDGSNLIAPSSAWDDGRFTYLKFSGNRDFPSVFLVKPDGTESIIDRHVDGDTLVIHRVATAFMLRSGSQVVGVYNEAFDPNGVPPQNGSSVPNIARTIKRNAPALSGKPSEAAKTSESSASSTPNLPTEPTAPQGQPVSAFGAVTEKVKQILTPPITDASQSVSVGVTPLPTDPSQPATIAVIAPPSETGAIQK